MWRCVRVAYHEVYRQYNGCNGNSMQSWMFPRWHFWMLRWGESRASFHHFGVFISVRGKTIVCILNHEVFMKGFCRELLLWNENHKENAKYSGSIQKAIGLSTLSPEREKHGWSGQRNDPVRWGFVITRARQVSWPSSGREPRVKSWCWCGLRWLGDYHAAKLFKRF